jgi:enoyl-CoA hydratase/carnithine racemase
VGPVSGSPAGEGPVSEGLAGEGLVSVDLDGEVAVVRLDRPAKHNALSVALETDLLAAVRSPAVQQARAVVLAGNGPSFCAGADVTEVRTMTTEAILAYYRASGRVYEAVAGLSVPSVAALHGHCLGGGLELALAATFRVADGTASLGFPEVGLGILPSSGGTTRVVQACGPVRARELLLLGRRVGAERAAEVGLVTEVVPDGDAVAAALRLAQELAALPAAAVEVALAAVDVAVQSPTAAALLVERLGYAALNSTAEAVRRQGRF